MNFEKNSLILSCILKEMKLKAGKYKLKDIFTKDYDEKFRAACCTYLSLKPEEICLINKYARGNV